MRRRLYFVLPNTDSARAVHNELLLALVEERHMHVIAREGSDLEGLPEANLLQKSDVVNGAKLGLIFGGITGTIVGVIGAIFFLADTGLGGATIAVSGLAGAFIGTWSSTMIAVNVPNTRLKKFQSDIDAGHLLFIVDVPLAQIESITQMIRKHHPEADAHGVEPTIPAFP